VGPAYFVDQKRCEDVNHGRQQAERLKEKNMMKKSRRRVRGRE
jgi:hypothetical protein